MTWKRGECLRWSEEWREAIGREETKDLKTAENLWWYNKIIYSVTFTYKKGPTLNSVTFNFPEINAPLKSFSVHVKLIYFILKLKSPFSLSNVGKGLKNRTERYVIIVFVFTNTTWQNISQPPPHPFHTFLIQPQKEILFH